MTKSCPLGHTCDRCLWHIHVTGQNPQTGAMTDRWDCAIAWIPILLIENSQQQLQTAAAVESFRNEMVKGNEAFIGMLQVASDTAPRRIGDIDAMERD